MKRIALCLAAALAACSSGPASIGARFGGPSAIVQFYGYTRNNSAAGAAPMPYLAVADARTGDLRLIDPSVDQPILGPGIVYPLSIVTFPRPSRLAAASLGDGKADVLVSASAGEPTLQVIETWTPQNRVAFEVPLGAQIGAGGDILAMVGFTATAADGVTKVGRILVAASGQQLVVVDFTRSPDGSGAVVAGAPVRQPLAFDAVDLALGPDGSTVYAATRDALSLNGGTVHGLVEIAAGGDAATPFATWIYDALAPTVAVAAAMVDERTVSTDPCAADTFAGQRVLRVYAALDPSACGPDAAIGCGIATLERLPGEAAGHLIADPAALARTPAPDPLTPDAAPVQALPFRPPMPVPNVPLHIAVANAPAKNTNADDAARVSTTLDTGGCPALGTAASPLARVLYGSGIRYTSALAMVTSSDGYVYWLDLSRYGPVVDSSPVALGLARTEVLSATSDVVGPGEWQLGLWYDLPGQSVSGKVVVDALTLPTAIETWPGFTPTSAWTAVYQGPLPDLAARPGVVAIDAASGAGWAAIQSDVGSAAGYDQPSRWWAPVQVDDPTRGVHVGDIVTFPDLGCEATVAAILPGATTPPAQTGNVAFPGGALALATPLPPCLAAAGSPLKTQITVLAGDVVVSNDASGYQGRARIALPGDAVADTVYTLAWLTDAELAASTDPDAAVKRLHARRLFYPTDGPCPLAGAAANTTAALPVGCYEAFPRMADPLSPGPAIRFRLGLRNVTTPDLPAAAADRPPRGAGVRFSTQSGLTQTSRRPTIGGTAPSTLVAVDPGDLVGHQYEDFRFYVAYQDDNAMWFSTLSTTSEVTSIR